MVDANGSNATVAIKARHFMSGLPEWSALGPPVHRGGAILWAR
jgi:hypothetical protein